jgi:hypothetical protein
MLSADVIHPSTLAFSVPVLLVKKSDGSWRFCIDYCTINNYNIKDKFPILVVELLEELYGTLFFTKLDLHSSYHQVWMHAANIHKTLFRTHEGMFQFLVMPFNLTNTPTTFQALMNEVLRPFLRNFVLVYFDDILIFSSSWSEHLHHICLVFAKLREHQLFVKRSKCSFGKRSVAYLGHVILVAVVAMDEHKVQAVMDWPVPLAKLL